MNKTKKRKILKWVGIGIGAFFLLIIIVAVATPSGQQSFNKGLQDGKQTVQGSLSKDDAIQKVQSYRLMKAFPQEKIEQGDTLLDAYNKRGEVPAVKNQGWYAEDTNETGKYIVGYKATIGSMENLPRWEVTNESIVALNGAAIILTPELQKKNDSNKQSGTTKEKEIFDYSTALYGQYEQEAFMKNDANPNDSADVQSQRLVDVENRAVKETAQKFGISESEVSAIISKLQ